LKTLENTAEQFSAASGTAMGTANLAMPAIVERPADLTPRQENFARLYAETGVALGAYTTAYDCEGSSRATARVNAFRLLRNPRIAARVRALQEAAAERSLRSTAGLIHDLEAMVECDPNELMRVDVGPCRRCYGVGGLYQWRDLTEYLDAMTQALDAKAALPSDAGGYGYRMDAEPNPACNHCGGSGVPRVAFSNTADVSPGARKLLKGIELFPDGTVKRVLLHDQSALRIELHRLRGLHIERSVSLNATVNVPALPKNMTVEQALRMLETIAPAPASDSPDSNVVSEQ
jgi:phage terminase small subunit